MSPKHRIRQVAFYVLAAICVFTVALWLFGPEQGAFPSWIDEVGPRLVASVALLILLLSGYVANPPALGVVGRAILLWGALALVLVVGYSYRDTLGALFN